MSEYIQVYSGKAFYPFKPRIDDISIFDIAHALSLQCRFSGHINQFYSVAQHCLAVSNLVAPKNALWGLLHDASEAYLVDIPGPLKVMPQFKEYREAEDRLQHLICVKYGLDPNQPEDVKHHDLLVRNIEATCLLGPPINNWTRSLPAYNGAQERVWGILASLSPMQVEKEFIYRFLNLTGTQVPVERRYLV